MICSIERIVSFILIIVLIIGTISLSTVSFEDKPQPTKRSMLLSKFFHKWLSLLPNYQLVINILRVFTKLFSLKNYLAGSILVGRFTIKKNNYRASNFYIQKRTFQNY